MAYHMLSCQNSIQNCKTLLLSSTPFSVFSIFWTFANSQISRIISLSIIQTTTGAFFFCLKALFIFLLFKNRFSLFRLHLVCRNMHERLVSFSLSCDEMMRSSSSLWIYPLYFSCTLKKLLTHLLCIFYPYFYSGLAWEKIEWEGSLRIPSLPAAAQQLYKRKITQSSHFHSGS